MGFWHIASRNLHVIIDVWMIFIKLTLKPLKSKLFIHHLIIPLEFKGFLNIFILRHMHLLFLIYLDRQRKVT